MGLLPGDITPTNPAGRARVNPIPGIVSEAEFAASCSWSPLSPLCLLFVEPEVKGEALLLFDLLPLECDSTPPTPAPSSEPAAAETGVPGIGESAKRKCRGGRSLGGVNEDCDPLRAEGGLSSAPCSAPRLDTGSICPDSADCRADSSCFCCSCCCSIALMCCASDPGPGGG
jgi:hypothetical protein